MNYKGISIFSLAYIDLIDAEDVYTALLGYGMFADKLPPCFSSNFLLDFDFKTNGSKRCAHASISYMATRNKGISRQLAIPHPESHMHLCKTIEKYWTSINEHIGKPKTKFNFCHVRKIKGKKHIFEMSYEGWEKWKKEECEQDYCLGCEYVVKADISTCFPSIYTHSIPWAIQGKDEAKEKRFPTNRKNKDEKSHWSNNLDRDVRNCNDSQTNGLLIGPHTSNIVSEIILTSVDYILQEKGFKKVIRYIDDYTYFAEDENNANNFLKTLELALKEYELLLNQKKTSICTLIEYHESVWTQKLNQFNFPDKEKIGFNSINAYLNLAISIAKDYDDFAPVNYAIKVISKKSLSDRAKKLYVKKILSLSLLYPYLIPLLEGFVLIFASNQQQSIKVFLPLLFRQSIERGQTDALSFCFYFAIKYGVKISKLSKKWREKVIEYNDCISILLAWKYTKKFRLKSRLFDCKVEEIKTSDKREQDRFWLFLYEHASDKSNIPEGQEYLKELKSKNISFLDFKISNQVK